MIAEPKLSDPSGILRHMQEESTGTAVWGSPTWRVSATAWLDEQLRAAGIERTGEVEQPHLRPWATALRAPTTSGPVWLKATAPGTSSEIGLYGLLRDVVPDRVLSPIAVDTDRSWIVLPDGGPQLESWLDRVDPPDALATVLPVYGRLQRDLQSHADQMVALGVPDMRPATLPRRFEEALAAVRPYIEETATDQDRRTYAQLTTMHATVAGWCAELESLPGAATIDHNDLHFGNVLVSGPDAMDQPRFYDWGDAVVAHPFASMIFPLWLVLEHVGGDPEHPQLQRVRDAYLGAFDDLGTPDTLVHTLELACRVGKIARALTWSRGVAALSGEEVAQWEREPYESLVSLLDESYLGGA